MTQTLHAYVVSLSWPGMMSLSPIMATTPELASAAAVMIAMRTEPIPTGDLAGVQVVEISVEWLRAAVRMIETGSADAAPIVRLVEPDSGTYAPWTPPEPAA